MLTNVELGEYLKNIRESKNISLREVEKLTEIGYSHLSMIENGKRNVTPALLKNLANVYHINYIDLYEKAGYLDLAEYERKETSAKCILPLLGTVKAGYDYLAQENWIGTVEVDNNLIKDCSEYFALNVKGDSMFPVLIEGDIVIVRKQEDFENGDIVVAIVNGDEATIKKGKKTSTGIFLQPLNTAYEPLIYTYDEMKSIPVIIVGIVKQLKREF